MKKLTIYSKEFGRGPASRDTFTTVEAASAYIKDRWQGVEYCDGPAVFHTDYCTYTLKGFTLEDVGVFGRDGEDRTFVFISDAKPVTPHPRACKVDDCDGAHCRKCGGHFLDFHNLALTLCDACGQEAADAAEFHCLRSDGFDARAPFPHASDPHWSDPRADFGARF